MCFLSIAFIRFSSFYGCFVCNFNLPGLLPVQPLFLSFESFFFSLEQVSPDMSQGLVLFIFLTLSLNIYSFWTFIFISLNLPKSPFLVTSTLVHPLSLIPSLSRSIFSNNAVVSLTSHPYSVLIRVAPASSMGPSRLLSVTTSV